MNATPEEHWVPADGGIGLHAWVYLPGSIPGGAGTPAITMAHGFGGLSFRGLIPFAERFAQAGFLAAYHDTEWDAFDHLFPAKPPLAYDKKITARSMLRAQTYDSGIWAERISQTPLLMIIGSKDTVIDPDLQRAAFARAGEPKRLVTYYGGHFAAYVQNFEVTAGSAEKWFTQYLMAGR